MALTSNAEIDPPWDAVDTPVPARSMAPPVASPPSPPPPPAPPTAPPPAPPAAAPLPRPAPPPARELPPSQAAALAKAAYEAAQAPGDAVPFDDASEPSASAVFVAAKAVDPLRLDELERLTPEIHLVSPELGDVYLVAAHTGQERNELTYREAAALRQMVDQFPGARVVSLRPQAAPLTLEQQAERMTPDEAAGRTLEELRTNPCSFSATPSPTTPSSSESWDA